MRALSQNALDTDTASECGAGSHIKGLFINFVHSFWPSLLKVPGFLQEFVTPIIKVAKGQTSVAFFSIPEYLEWKANTENAKDWKIKYADRKHHQLISSLHSHGDF